MKKLNLLPVLLIILLTAFAANAFAQAGHDTSKANNIVIDAKGGIYNHDGTKLGYITKDDIVKNSKGEKLYFIDREGNVIDAKGNKLGMAKKNGNYYNNKGQTVLQLKNINNETCAILDPQGHNLGTVHKNYKLHACASHCYFLAQKKLKDAKTKE